MTTFLTVALLLVIASFTEARLGSRDLSNFSFSWPKVKYSSYAATGADCTCQNPTNSPTETPTKSPTALPTPSPTESPTASPTESPTSGPTKSPTGSPTTAPTNALITGQTLATLSPTASPYDPAVQITATAYKGNNGDYGCDMAVDLIEASYGADITICLKITNSGNTYLGNFEVRSDAIQLVDQSIELLAPGQSTTISSAFVFTDTVTVDSTVVANPVDPAGVDLPNIDDAEGSDVVDVLEAGHAVIDDNEH